MIYKIVIESKVEKELFKIPEKFRRLIDKAILNLASEPRPIKALKLTEANGYRIRVGNYRILYMVDDESEIVVIYRVKIRNEKTYKDLS